MMVAPLLYGYLLRDELADTRASIDEHRPIADGHRRTRAQDP
jgi:hypothetical protein